MGKIIAYDLSENYVEKVASLIKEKVLSLGSSSGRVAVIFEGKRPSYFINKAIADENKGAYFPPVFFSIDEFIEYISGKGGSFRKVSDLDMCYNVYKAARKAAPRLLKGREGFSKFLPWAQEISKFMDELYYEDITEEDIDGMKGNQALGQKMPDGIRELLLDIFRIKRICEENFRRENAFTKGMIYKKAADLIKETRFDEFDSIYFCNVFSLYKSERKILKSVFARDKVFLVYHGSQEEWRFLDDIAKDLASSISTGKPKKTYLFPDIYTGIDSHTQVGIVRELIRKEKDKDNTVVVLSDPDNAIPLLSEISAETDKFNISLGYSADRSSAYNLLEAVFRAQSTSKDGFYYVKDYLNVLMHPFVKNLSVVSGGMVTRTIVHKIEEAILGITPSSFQGTLFIDPRMIEVSDEISGLVVKTLEGMSEEITTEDVKKAMARIHEAFFYSWSTTGTFADLAVKLSAFTDDIVHGSFISEHGIEVSVMKEILDLCEEFENTEFSREKFDSEDMFRIFLDRLKDRKISFSTDRMKGLQILELMETRSLNFRNVIIMDFNESSVPRIKLFEPLIPREVKICLGMKKHSMDEEIQRYQFSRLIAYAKKTSIVYESSDETEKSRFLEDVIWAKQKRDGKIDVADAVKGRFSMEVLNKKAEVSKTQAVLRFLSGDFGYSASSIDTYLRCPLRFYYRYVLGLKEKKDLTGDIEGSDIGTFIHELLQDTFKRFEGRFPLLDKAFEEFFFSQMSEKFDKEMRKRMKSDSFAFFEILQYRLSKFLESEKIRLDESVGKLLYVEKELKGNMEVSGGSYKLTSKIDRIDRLKDGSVLIIDYKTGGDDPMPSKLAKIREMEMSREAIKKTVKSFQLPLYIHMLDNAGLVKTSGVNVDACLYYVRKAEIKSLFEKDKIEDFKEALNVYMTALDFIISEINDPKACFVADEDDSHYCKNCPFFYLCK